MVFRLIVWFIMIFGGIAGGYYLDSKYFNGIRTDLFFHIVSFIAGIFLFRLVIRISKNTGRTLAKYGRKGKLKRGETNVLVKAGPYKYMRHPMHLGLFLFPLAVGFLVGSPSFILFIAPAEILFMLVMIKFFEEPEAIKKFGDDYIEYKKAVPPFCLKKECLKELLKKTE